jgi:hypothetical protein
MLSDIPVLNSVLKTEQNLIEPRYSHNDEGSANALPPFEPALSLRKAHLFPRMRKSAKCAFSAEGETGKPRRKVLTFAEGRERRIFITRSFGK